MLNPDKAGTVDPGSAGTAYERYVAQEAEWKEICEELVGNAESNHPVTAYQVTLEQRKRMLARGERPMEYKEILAAIAEETALRGVSTP